MKKSGIFSAVKKRLTRERAGFTLVELLVVVAVLGILTTIAVPYYYKTVETSKANNALGIGHMIANSNRMWNLDHEMDASGSNDWITGRLTNACNSGNCQDNSNRCNLIRCGYMAANDWDQGGNAPYWYYQCNADTGAGGGCCRRGFAACVRRVNARGIYAGWGYRFSEDGSCSELSGSTPECPAF